jgi:hypothetical protein
MKRRRRVQRRALDADSANLALLEDSIEDQ